MTNTGPNDAVDAKVVDVLPDELINSTWSATGTPGTSFTPSGTGDLDETFDIPVGGRITYTIRSDIAVDLPEPLVNTVTVTATLPQIDVNPDDNTATDIADGNVLSLLADGPAIAGQPGQRRKR